MTSNEADSGFDSLIPIVNELHDISSSVGEGLNFDLPLIAVVGSQSAGKSSVLENFVGKDFLPRGSGIVTRRPLVLKLVHTESKEFGVFLHNPQKKIHSYFEIRDEIEAETERSVPGKQVSNNPINLTIYSPHVVDLTLVDLPGMTKVAVGNQDKDISNTIRNMLLEFIAKDNCLILAVTPANTDLANSDALNIAAEVDPSGLRTIGVLTKLDLMDEGTDAYDILTNKVIPLRRGYVGIVNRSQKDITGNRDIAEAQKAEAEFFLQHPKYRSIANSCGTHYLQRLLSEQLTNHIRSTLPKMLRNIEEKHQMLARELEELNSSDVSSPEKRVNFISKSINEIQFKFHQTLYGDADIGNEEFSFGYKIKGYLGHRLWYELNKGTEDISFTDKQIQISISNANGINPALFLSPSVIENPISIVIKHLNSPINKIVDMVVTDLKSVVQEITEPLSNYPEFYDYIHTTILHKLNEKEAELKKYCAVIIDSECNYIYTSNKAFCIASNPVANTKKKKNKKTKMGENEGNEKIKAGHCQILNIKQMKKKEYYFVLTRNSLTVYSHSDMDNIKISIPINILVLLNEDDTGIWITTDDESEIVKNEVELHFDVVKNANDDINDWKSAILSVGAKSESNKRDSTNSESSAENNPEESSTMRDVVMIKTMLSTYTDTVVKNMCDTLPKIIVEFLIRQLESYIRTYLMAQILTKGDTGSFFSVKRETVYQIEETKKFYTATEKAMCIVKRIISSTRNTPIPPPVKPKDTHTERVESKSKSVRATRRKKRESVMEEASKDSTSTDKKEEHLSETKAASNSTIDSKGLEVLAEETIKATEDVMVPLKPRPSQHRLLKIPEKSETAPSDKRRAKPDKVRTSRALRPPPVPTSSYNKPPPPIPEI